MIDDILLEAEDKMDKGVNFLHEEFRKIRTGQASPALVEGIKVDYYGTPTPLRQIAQIAIPGPTLITIKPYDMAALGEIEKAILKSDLGITPSNDGKIIRLSLPPLSQERRKQLAGRIKEMAEQAKVSIRNVRKEAMKQLDKAEDEGVPEDDADRAREDIQKLVKDYETKAEDVLAKKSKEIMEF
ncbi:MAG: ribosome recycling factor [Planctomycetota bacterium]